MAGTVRRLTSVTKRGNISDASNAGDDISNAGDYSEFASGLSSGVVDISAIGENVVDNGDVDPEAPYGRKADGTPRKRRGRQPRPEGSEKVSRSCKAKKSVLGIEGLASIMCNLTLMIAAASKVPEASLSNEETTLIAEAAENVAQYYDFSVNSKAVAWANLAVTTGGIIGSHVIAYKMRREAELRRAA